MGFVSVTIAYDKKVKPNGDMIEYRRDNLLDDDAEALVNTVNTVGVMGKGIALQFKKRFPENFKAYKRACEKEEVEVGKMFTFFVGNLNNPRYIINFPTKEHWRGKSRIEYVEDGLEDLVREVEERGIKSIAIPPLGCGIGSLEWEEVRPLIEKAVARMSGGEAHVYEPGSVPEPKAMKVGTPKPHLTTARAAMLKLIDLYGVAQYHIGRLEAQKLAYFAQAAGEESFGLDFTEDKFGPFAKKLNFLLEILEGHYIVGYGDHSQGSQINLLDGASEAAEEFLRTHPESMEHIECVAALIQDFEIPYGMELLSTVHWAATQKGANSPEEAAQTVRNWTPRKGDLFNERHVRVAWERLEEEGWLPSESLVHN
ncbi:MAG: macro domain-containing protein [Actinomycetota bacterium]|nr:macro domain-containing protein [Actinomycetota bacterium]